MKKINKLIFALLPIILGGCSQNKEQREFPAINDQQAIMKEYYRQHTSNQSYLNIYECKETLSYDPEYDVFGSLAPYTNAKNLYYESTYTNKVEIYSGYFINKNIDESYLGNKTNIGSKYKSERNDSFWFRAFDDGRKDTVELIRRHETKESDLEATIVDYHSGIEVENENVSHYFSNNINTDYKDYFAHPLTQPIASTSRQVSAYKKSENEIIETYKEVSVEKTMENPVHPSDEYELTVIKQIVGETTFKSFEKIGWVGTSFKESITYSLVSDYELKLLDQPRVILKRETNVKFTYSNTMQPYSGEAYVFQENDEKKDLYRPSMFVFDGNNFRLTNISSMDISKEYKKVHPEFSGYAYRFTSVIIEENVLYSFACEEDVLQGKCNTIGYNQLIKNAGGTIVSGGIGDLNLIKTITISDIYEFIVLISTTGNKALIAHLNG